jgi:hypothetical protein
MRKWGMKGLGCFDMSEIDEAFGLEDPLGTIPRGLSPGGYLGL